MSYQMKRKELRLQRDAAYQELQKYVEARDLETTSQKDKDFCEDCINKIIAETLPRIDEQLRTLRDTDPITQVPSEEQLKKLEKAIRDVQAFNVKEKSIRELAKIFAGAMADIAGGRTAADIAIVVPTTPPPAAMLATAAAPAPFAGFGRAAAAASLAIADGRWRGMLPELAVDLRIDGASGIASADLFRLDPLSRRTWVAAFRTVPNGLAFDGGALVAVDRYGARSEGRLHFAAVDATTAQLTLRFDKPLDGLPFGRNIVLIVRFGGAALREIGLELELENGVPLPPTTTFAGAPMNIEAALSAAGIELTAIGVQNELKKAPVGGWSEKDIEEQMFAAAQSPLDRPEFAIHLLWLSKSNRPGLLGVMFDVEDDLPRQGLAVFAGAIAEAVPPADLPRKLIQTAVHEIGHALNLAHRFEREVGRADSTSFMNYDWRFRGGNRAPAFWQQFAYRFDTDELAFLRHAPYPQIVPGGAPFHSVRYWADGDGGYSPYVPEEPFPGHRLELLAPAEQDFMFGQPVILGVRFTNETGRPLSVPVSMLDPKTGLLEVLIRRVRPGRRLDGPSESFTPIATRCFDLGGDGLQRLEPGQSMEDNLNLIFGAAGFPFAEPGHYDVTAVLVSYDRGRDVEFLAPSNTLRVRVAYPESREADRDATSVLLRQDVGRWFALGGPSRLKRAQEDVLRVAERAPVPIATNIARSAMFGRAREGDVEAALRHAETVRPVLEKVFDSVTAKQTAAFIKGLAKRRKS